MLGAVASVVCFFAVTRLKPKLGYDDALDTFGVHGIGGMVGAIGTGIVYSAVARRTEPAPAGTWRTSCWVQFDDRRHDDRLGRRRHRHRDLSPPSCSPACGSAPDVEREGLDLGEHGERAYNM